MGWVYLDDGFTEHPKVLAAGDLAAWLYVSALVYVQRSQTLGVIPRAVVPRLTGLPKPMQLAAKLVEVRLWHEVEDGYEIHDYQERNWSAVEAAERRSAAGRQAAKARWARRDEPPSNPPDDAIAMRSHMRSHPNGTATAVPSHYDSNPIALRRQSDRSAIAMPTYGRASVPKPQKPKNLKPSPDLGEETLSSSNLSTLDEDDDDGFSDPAWLQALDQLRKRETDVGPVHSRRHWLAAAYANNLADQALTAERRLDEIAAEIELAEHEGRGDIATYLRQTARRHRRTVEADQGLKQATGSLCRRCGGSGIWDIVDDPDHPGYTCAVMCTCRRPQ